MSKTIPAPDHLIAKYSSDEQIRLASQRQADADLLCWLQMRAKELTAGGHLIATFARTVPADEPNSDWRGWDIVNQACDIWLPQGASHLLSVRAPAFPCISERWKSACA